MNNSYDRLKHKVDALIDSDDCDPQTLHTLLQCQKIAKDIYSNKSRTITALSNWIKTNGIKNASMKPEEVIICLDTITKFIKDSSHDIQ